MRNKNKRNSNFFSFSVPLLRRLSSESGCTFENEHSRYLRNYRLFTQGFIQFCQTNPTCSDFNLETSSFVVQHWTDVWSGKGMKFSPQWSPGFPGMKGAWRRAGGLIPKRVGGGGEYQRFCPFTELGPPTLKRIRRGREMKIGAVGEGV